MSRPTSITPHAKATAMHALRRVLSTPFSSPTASRLLHLALGATLIGIVMLTAHSAWEHIRGSVEVDIEVIPDDARPELQAALFVNSLRIPPQRVAYSAGKRQTLSFDIATDRITLLRLDPNDTPATVRIYGIDIKRGSQIIRHYAPSDIARFETQFVPSPHVDAALVYKAPNLSSVQSVESVPVSNTALALLADLLPDKGQRAYYFQAVKAGLALTFLAFIASGQITTIAAAVASLVTLWLALEVGRTFWTGSLPTAAAVGYEQFHGLSLAASRAGLLLGLFLSVCAGFAIARLKLVPSLAGSPRFAAAEATPLSRLSPLVIGAGAIVVFMWGDLAFYLQQLSTRTIDSNWDSQQVLMWSYLAHTGKLPFRDFWYPYGGRYQMSLPAPFGFIAANLYTFVVYSSLFFVIYKITRFGLIISVLITLVFVWGEATGALSQLSRHLLAATLALSLVTIDWRSSRIQSGHVFFNLLCCTAMATELTQLIYAAIACLAVLAVQLSGPPWLSRWKILVRHFVLLFAIPTLVLFALIVDYSVTGRLKNAADFYLGFSDQAAYSSIPFDFLGSFSGPASMYFIALATPFVLTSIGMLDIARTWASRKGDTAPLPSVALLACGLLGWMLLQKHAIRGMDWQLAFLPALGFLFLIAREQILRYRTVHLLNGALIMVFGVMLAVTGAFFWASQVVRSRPVMAEQVLSGLYVDHDAFNRANADAFARARFKLSGDEAALITYLQKEAGNTGHADVYALSDNPLLYMLVGRAPPYFVTNYNASPIYEQEKNVQWIMTHRPAFMIFDPHQVAFGGRPNTFDDVPNPVRIPLLFEQAALSYRFHDRVGRFDVLRRNRDGELPDLDYWNQALGNDLEFGRLADKSSFPKLSPCEPNRTANCLPFVSVKLRSPVSGNQPITLALSAGRFHYRIHFKSAPGQSQYYLPVGRMWFYAALSRAGLSLQIDGIEGITDVEVSGAYRIVPSSILY